jgi:ABC-type nitrate/sulfonate/bicarbonate transport system substrate-binding protein
MSGKENDSETKEIIHELDDILPGDVDRRGFLNGSLALIGAGIFAGCSGDGTGTGTETGTGTGDMGFQDDEEIEFTTSWRKEPSHGAVHVTEMKGYWEDEGVPNVDGVRGNGSDTEALNIGTGSKEMGYTSFATAVSVWGGGEEDIDALDMSLVGIASARPFLSLIWRTDELDDHTDIAGKNVLLASGFAAATWDMYPELAGVDQSEVSSEAAGEETGPPRLANNEVQAVWGSIDLLTAYEDEADVELKATPLTELAPVPGLTIWANNEWYDNKDNAVEFTSAVLTGYNKALKWVLLHGDEYIDYMRNEVNPNLQTWTDEELYGQYETWVASAVNLNWQDEGIGYFTQDEIKTALDGIAPALLDDPDMLPSASEMVNREPFEKSETVEFTDEEWNQLAETGGRFWDLFKEAEES